VDVRAVRKVFDTRSGPVHALEDINLDVREGEFVSLLGPSGCGKSTLLSIIAGLIPASAGTVSVLGRAVVGPVVDLGIVFQQDLLLPWRSVLKNVMLQIEVRRLPTRQYLDRARELLALVGLDGFLEKLPAELSGGMRQRVAICRALVHNPPLLLMDEPFGALDAMTRDQMNLDLQRLAERQRTTIVFVTHSISEAVFLSDRVVVVSPRPGRVEAILGVPLPRPRRLSVRDNPEFNGFTREIRVLFERMGILREEP
jgi:NitT/TauT family transport system ATP-binding protein